MKRALWKPVLLTSIVLAIVTASGWLIRGNAGSDQRPQAPNAHEPAARTADIPQADEPARADRSPKGAEIPKAVAASKPGENTNAEEHRQLLETVGVLAAAHCYQTYFNIGLIADGKAKGVYSRQEAYNLLDSVLSVVDSADRKLAALGKVDLDREDRASLEQMRGLSDLLRQQGKELEAFWDSGKEEDADRYENTRKDAWAAISKLMGVGR